MALRLCMLVHVTGAKGEKVAASARDLDGVEHVYYPIDSTTVILQAHVHAYPDIARLSAAVSRIDGVRSTESLPEIPIEVAL